MVKTCMIKLRGMQFLSNLSFRTKIVTYNSFTEYLTLITQVMTEGYRVGSGQRGEEGVRKIEGQNVLEPVLCFTLFSRDRWLKHA